MEEGAGPARTPYSYSMSSAHPTNAGFMLPRERVGRERAGEEGVAQQGRFCARRWCVEPAGLDRRLLLQPTRPSPLPLSRITKVGSGPVGRGRVRGQVLNSEPLRTLSSLEKGPTFSLRSLGEPCVSADVYERGSFARPRNRDQRKGRRNSRSFRGKGPSARPGPIRPTFRREK